MRNLLSSARSVFLTVVFLLLVGVPAYVAYLMLRPVPDVGRDLPTEIAMAKTVFAERVAERYVPPMPEPELISRLRADHFAIHESRGYAEFTKGGLACSRQMRVHWQAEGGIVTIVTGRYAVTCL